MKTKEKKKASPPIFKGVEFQHVNFYSNGLEFFLEGVKCAVEFSPNSWFNPCRFELKDKSGYYFMWMNGPTLNGLMTRAKKEKRAWIVIKLCTYFTSYTQTGGNKLLKYIRRTKGWEDSLLIGLVRSASGRKLSLMKIQEILSLVRQGIKEGLFDKEHRTITSLKNLEMKAMCRRIEGRG